MSQMMSQIPRQLMQQQQRLTPQLIQAMDILQLNAMALESRIEQELDSNPALELAPDESEVSPEAASATSTENADAEQSRAEAEEGSEDFERLDSLVSEYDWLDDDAYRGTRSKARLSEEGDAKMEAMANSEARPICLREFLLDQWSLADADGPARVIGEAIIDAIDDHGRLATSLEKLTETIEPTPTRCQMGDALARVQRLEPSGIAARDLQECLLLQLETMPIDTEFETRIIEEHFEDLQKNRLPLIAKSLGVEVDDIKGALGVIGRLSMHPGLDVTDKGAPRIIPDVIVEYDEESDRYETRLSRGNARELRISAEFREALEKSRGDKAARDFLKQKLEAASAIIDAVRYRRNRLLEVAIAVVDAQHDFLKQGEQHLRVLRMSDMATDFGCDPSTISRTVDEKWIQTPRGIYPLRRFFTGGTESESGEVLGWDSIKAKVQEIVDNEDKSKPLSDDVIVSRLSGDGIEIKRRTVAKYRAQLGIPTARQRRQY